MDTYRDCLVCGKAFKVCRTCRKDIDEVYQWRRVVCCPEHFAFHIPIIDYVRGNIDKETAKNDLEKAISQYGEVDYCEDIKSVVAEIMGDNNKVAETIDIADTQKKTKK